jgi:hypothetical protein
MGRTAYEAMAGALPTADHPFFAIMNAARKVDRASGLGNLQAGW